MHQTANRDSPGVSCGRSRVSGFTLIEVMVATGLGLAVLFLVAQGFRYATQAMLHARSLALENAMLRGAFVTALEECDFWNMYDQPEGADPSEPNTGGQGLREVHERRTGGSAKTYLLAQDQSGSARSKLIKRRVLSSASHHGMTFTPFSAMQNLSEFNGSDAPAVDRLDDVFRVAATLSDPAALPGELDRGWRKHAAWNAADPRTWYRGCLGQRGNSDLRWGHYGLVSHPRLTANLGQGTNLWVREARAATPPVVIPVFGTVRPLHSWRDNQILGLRASLGNFGLLEYLPSNTVMATHGALMPDARPNLSPTAMMRADERVSGLWIWSDWFAGAFDATFFDGMVAPGVKVAQTARGFGKFGAPLLPRSMYASYEYNDPTTSSDVLMDADTIPREAMCEMGMPMRNWWLDAGLSGNSATTNWGWEGKRSMAFLRAIAMLKPQLVQKPDTWPDVYIGQRRYYANSRFNCVSTLRWASPSGGLGEISFSAFGTSLRGARQQRAKGGGWAIFHGVAYNQATGVLSDLAGNTATLDEP